MADHKFCRLLLQGVMEDVRKVVPKEIIKEAWTYKYNDGRQEFQIPSQKFYWYGQACCGWYARVLGWEEYLRKEESESVVCGASENVESLKS